jgi:hypothetical protein
MSESAVRTVQATFVALMGLTGIAIGNRVYGHFLLKEMVRAVRARPRPRAARSRLARASGRAHPRRRRIWRRAQNRIEAMAGASKGER